MCTLLQAKLKLSTVIVIASDLKSFPFFTTENDQHISEMWCVFQSWTGQAARSNDWDSGLFKVGRGSLGPGLLNVWKSLEICSKPKGLGKVFAKLPPTWPSSQIFMARLWIRVRDRNRKAHIFNITPQYLLTAT